jgi:hypothetical protein
MHQVQGALLDYGVSDGAIAEFPYDELVLEALGYNFIRDEFFEPKLEMLPLNEYMARSMTREGRGDYTLSPGDIRVPMQNQE